MTGKNILIAAPWPQGEQQRLQDEGHTIEVWDVPSSEVGSRTSELYEKLAGVHALIFTPHIKITDEFRDAAPESLQILSSMSAGIDHIKRVAPEHERFQIGYTPGITDGAVAELTLATALMLRRGIHRSMENVALGNTVITSPFERLGHSLSSATVGIIGAGKIGQAAGRLFKLHGCEVVQNSSTPGDRGDIPGLPRPKLLEQADIVTIHVPLTPETDGMVDETFLTNMRKDAVLINMSRGKIIEQDALLRALNHKDERGIGGAALDVTTPDPLPPNHELVNHPQTIVLPHIGSATYETRHAMARHATENTIRALRGEPMLSPLPQIA
jgi:phosphoglycerate dehydrogenase-like enzyme